MKKHYMLFTLLLMSFVLFAQPANDDCINAENIEISTSSISVSFDINSATLNNQTICDSTDDYADVWYKFTMPVNGNVFVNGTIGWNNFALYNDCSTAAITCGSASQLFDNLVSGNTYYLRVYRPDNSSSNTGYQTFSIRAFEEVTNDDCDTSENITVSTDRSTVNFDIGGASINNEEGCAGTTNDYVDIWYDFTMPVNGNIYIQGTIGYNNFALYDACDGEQIQCGDANEFISGLTSGTNYKLRVFRTVSAADDGYLAFNIQAYEEAANDDCDSSENISVTTEVSTVNFNIGGASINNEEGCAGTTSDYLDVWYDFTMPVNGNIYIHGSVGYNNFALYDACGGEQIHCGDANEFIAGLTSGTNYKLRVFRTVSTADDGYLAFDIIAYEETANDNCDSSENITVTTDRSTINFDIGGASVNNEEGCVGTTSDYLDVWFDFTMPVNGNLYIHGSVGYNNFALYDACDGEQIHCGNANEFITGLTSGTNYKLRVFRTVSTADDGYLSFNIEAYEEVANDDCDSSENISVTTDISTVNFDIGGATVNNEEGCSGITNDYLDVWYDFTMPVNGNIYLNGSVSYNNFALYDACGGTEIQCGNINELITGLTATTNYKLRVFRTTATADDGYLSFSIQAFEIINNDDCASSENIVISESPTTVNFGIAGANINNEVGCMDTDAADYADVWYDFSIPTDGTVFIDGTLSWNKFAVYDACNGNQITCFEGEGYASNLTGGTNYKLRVFRALSLVDNKSYKSFTIQNTTNLDINDSAKSNQISIYPNPVKEVIKIKSNHPINAANIYDLMGKRVLSVKQTDIINTNTLNPAVYILKIKTDAGETTKKIIKI